MYSFASCRKEKAGFIPLFFVFVFLTSIILLQFVFQVARGSQESGYPVAMKTVPRGLVEPQKTVNKNFPLVQKIPTILQKVSVAKASQKTIVVAEITVPKKLEARLIVPKINVNAVIKEMGFTSEGAMAVPDNTVDVGWFSLGTRPGETGSAVIGGHNRWDAEAGVFNHLDKLKKGDIVSVVDAKGISTFFVVREMRTYDATDVNTGIFESESGIHLNLITCSGVWDPSTKSYTKRLVIFTDLDALAK